MRKGIVDWFDVLPDRSGRQQLVVMSLAAFLSLCFLGCATPVQTVGLTAGVITGTTLVGSRSPGHEMEQVYYVGTIDPLEQLPPTVYRLTVRGQSSGFSSVRFASGWAPSQLIDSLSSWAQFSDKDSGGPAISGTNSVNLASDRRFILFGPEGFRPAPRDHRLVMVMGANPDHFFQAIDEVLGSMAKVSVAQEDDAFRTILLKELLETSAEKMTLREIQEDLDLLKGSAGGGQ